MVKQWKLLRYLFRKEKLLMTKMQKTKLNFCTKNVLLKQTNQPRGHHWCSRLNIKLTFSCSANGISLKRNGWIKVLMYWLLGRKSSFLDNVKFYRLHYIYWTASSTFSFNFQRSSLPSALNKVYFSKFGAGS